MEPELLESELLDPELEPFEEEVPEEGVVVLDDPELPVLELEEVPDVEDVLLVELEPEFPVVVEVAAAAASAPPARSPEVRAPMASMLRRRMCMGDTFHVL